MRIIMFGSKSPHEIHFLNHPVLVWLCLIQSVPIICREMQPIQHANMSNGHCLCSWGIKWTIHPFLHGACNCPFILSWDIKWDIGPFFRSWGIKWDIYPFVRH
uniref:Uncharacterized protein n=1 Tax=Cacopsylla melanoneura TaxID=428564 RepID=A0A8D9E8V6_9HEMI